MLEHSPDELATPGAVGIVGAHIQPLKANAALQCWVTTGWLHAGSSSCASLGNRVFGFLFGRPYQAP